MKSKILLLVVVGLACCCIAACSTSNQSNLPVPDWSKESFSVKTTPGTGTFTPELKVDEQATGATVTITAKDAVDLSAAYVTLLYNTRKYTPESVEIGSFMGRDGEVISLSLTNRYEEVPVGVAQIPSTGVAPRNGAGVLAVVRFRAEPYNGPRTVSAKTPVSQKNAVTDMTVVSSTNGSADLRWTEKNIGDYDNNSEVNLADITPIGQLFRQSKATAADPIWVGMVDGDNNGVINLADITPVGANFGNKLSGYTLFTDNAGSVPYGAGITAPRPAVPADKKHTPVVYTFTANFEPGSGPKFTVRGACDGKVRRTSTLIAVAISHTETHGVSRSPVTALVMPPAQKADRLNPS